MEEGPGVVVCPCAADEARVGAARRLPRRPQPYRSVPRYSADCISFSLDAVRSNSNAPSPDG